LIDGLQNLIHQEADAYDRNAGTHHQQNADRQGCPFRVTVHECLDQHGPDYGGGHLNEKQNAYGDRDHPS
jgi:hypothetical protein